MNQPNTGRSVRDLQEMLLTISDAYPQIPAPLPDGVFGERTLEAVMVFQRDFGLPVNGVVDHATWEAIYRTYRDVLRQMGPPPALRVLPHGKTAFRAGDQAPQVRLIQALFDSLRQVLPDFERTGGDGLFQGATQRNARRLQRACGLPETEIMDRATWDVLARLYHLFITRGAPLFSSNPLT